VAECGYEVLSVAKGGNLETNPGTSTSDRRRTIFLLSLESQADEFSTHARKPADLTSSNLPNYFLYFH
jgi:hypothetical protein